jgi:hypothetical protein
MLPHTTYSVNIKNRSGLHNSLILVFIRTAHIAIVILFTLTIKKLPLSSVEQRKPFNLLL